MLGNEAIPFPDPEEPDNFQDPDEAELQQELRGIFKVDTQKYLQNYLESIEKLEPSSWQQEIQAIYRSIHTIKGGAVTVSAKPILEVATALEDLLSDLRYLQPPPTLEDGQLKQILLEAGELLASAISIASSDTSAIVARIQTLHQQVKERYFDRDNQQQLIHQEFLQEGFDLVVLDLETAVENLPATGTIPPEIYQLARDLFTRLEEIGRDIQLSSGWQELLNQGRELLSQSQIEFWRSNLPQLFTALKNCAKQGGKAVEFAWQISPAEQECDCVDSLVNWLEDIDIDLELAKIESGRRSYKRNSDFDETLTNLDLEVVANLLEDEDFDLLDAEKIEVEQDAPPPKITSQPEKIRLEHDAPPATTEREKIELEGETPPAKITSQPEKIRLEHETPPPTIERAEKIQVKYNPPVSKAKQRPNLQPAIAKNVAPEKVQIPVPLERLDRSAEYLIDTLVAARSARNFYNNIQNQLVQLISLAKEGVDKIGNLRQLQDDYALLKDGNINDLDLELTPDRYRQGYTTINRLLEMNLRLSELGSEVEITAEQTAESLSILENNILKLQNTVEESRLVPFQNLAFRAKVILRDLTNRHPKLAQLAVTGGEIELEVGVVKSLEPALLHLIRNAYAHGIESIEERIKLNKPARGTISLNLSHHGNYFLLELQDDGAGIDAELIQATAEAKGLPLTETKDIESLLSVICQPGLSSCDEINDMCGRGVGMDVVKEQIDLMGGKLSLETVLGKGTTFRLEFPVPHFLVSCITIRAGDRIFAIPTENIATTAIFADLEVSKIADPEYAYSYLIETETEQIPGFDLLQYWQPSHKIRTFDETAICIYLPCERNPDKTIWLLADELLDRSDLSIESLPDPLITPMGLMGVSLQADGSLIPVLETAVLGEYFLNSSRKIETNDAIASESTSNTILIVDDAALMRRRIQASLNAYGYLTQTCSDGREAWDWLSQNPHPALIVTDVDMPNMDGFTLTSNCRKAGIKTPILIVSSRVAEEWSKEAKLLGASGYLTKGFATSELIDRIKSLLGD
ncbi:MAG: response regulator [Prochloraceae cyanobacterium]|nr:response regulator [Prochloraceae cyanobacterium]